MSKRIPETLKDLYDKGVLSFDQYKSGLEKVGAPMPEVSENRPVTAIRDTETPAPIPQPTSEKTIRMREILNDISSNSVNLKKLKAGGKKTIESDAQGSPKIIEKSDVNPGQYGVPENDLKNISAAEIESRNKNQTRLEPSLALLKGLEATKYFTETRKNEQR